MARYERAYGDSDLKRQEKKAEKARLEQEERERERERRKALVARTSGAQEAVARVLAQRMGTAASRLDPNTLMRTKVRDAKLDQRTAVGKDSPLNAIDPSLPHEKYEQAEVKVAYTALEEARHAAFKRQREKEKTDFLDAVDGDYWVLVCFCTRAQREAFLTATGWKEEHFIEGAYVDGVGLAKDMKIELPGASLRWYGTKSDRRLVEEVGIIPTQPAKRR
jgi:hypothetical protein